MSEGNNELEALWEALLSRQEQLVIRAFNKIDPQEQQAVLKHLKRMVSEPGWQPEQITSARAALDILTGKK